MDPVDASGSDAQLIVLRVVIRSPDVDTFISKYSRFLKDDRIFIFTKASQPPGTRVRFTLELAEGPALLHGVGTVTRIRPDQGDPAKPPGMELRFEPIDQASRNMVERMLNARGTTQLPMSQPIQVGPQTDSSPPTRTHDPSPQTGTNPGTQVPTNPGPSSSSIASPVNDSGVSLPSIPNLPAIPPSSLPPIPRSSLPPIPKSSPPRHEDVSTKIRTEMPVKEERTDVDAAKNKEKFRQHETPPPFVTTPTPLPAPLPLPTIMTPPHGTVAPTFSEAPTKAEKVPDLQPAAKPELPPLQATPFAGMPAHDMPVHETHGDEHTGAFATVDGAPAPRFAESYVGPLPAPPGAPTAAPTGTVPANPFAEISDNTIEYFVAWSLEQSTSPHPKKAKPPEASFANVPIRAPRAERDPAAAARLRLYIGVMVGLALGIPLGAAGMWAFKPFGQGEGPFAMRAPAADRSHAVPRPAPPVVVSKTPVVVAPPPATPAEEKPAAEKPEPPAEKPVAVKPAAEKPVAEKPVAAKPVAAKPVVAKPVAAEKAAEPAEEKPVAAEKPAPATAEKPATAAGEKPADELPGPPALAAAHKGKMATLRVRSTPAGAEVLVRGVSYGATPVDVELPPGHRYDVEVRMAGKKQWKKRINLDPPLTEITAKMIN
jgi:Tfp pilus assembly protein PilZ